MDPGPQVVLQINMYLGQVLSDQPTWASFLATVLLMHVLFPGGCPRLHLCAGQPEPHPDISSSVRWYSLLLYGAASQQKQQISNWRSTGQNMRETI